MKKKKHCTLKILAWIVTRYHRMIHKVRILRNGSIEVMNEGNLLILTAFPQRESSWPITDLERMYQENPVPEHAISDILGKFSLNRDLWDKMIIVSYRGTLTAIKNIPYKGFRVSKKSASEILNDTKEFLSFEKRAGSKKDSYKLIRTLYTASSTTLVSRR